ncbi:MAG: carboxypeptidase-like regulatory domain-containing protein, partial [Polaribacter sp.]|nr:carboxypeptidase-like regulatory domain-containing protein [Polaribacter sp.]
MRKKITFLLFALSTMIAFSQTFNVKGVVKDAVSGETLPGVSVVIKGTSIGTETNFDGVFNLANVKQGATLVLNYLGKKPKEVVVT